MHRVRAAGAMAQLAVRALGGECCQDREPKRAAEQPRGVDEPRRQTGLARRDSGHRGDRHGNERQADSDRDQQRRQQNVAEVAATDRDVREHQQAGCLRDHPGDQQRLRSDSRHGARRIVSRSGADPRPS